MRKMLRTFRQARLFGKKYGGAYIFWNDGYPVGWTAIPKAFTPWTFGYDIYVIQRDAHQFNEYMCTERFGNPLKQKS